MEGSCCKRKASTALDPDEDGALRISLVSLSGGEVAAFVAQPSWGLREVQQAAGLQETVLETKRILFGGEELKGERTLADLRVASGDKLCLVVSKRLCVLLVSLTTVEVRCSTDASLLRSFSFQERVFSAAFSPDNTAVLTAAGSAGKLWSVAEGRLLNSFFGHAAAVTAAVFSPEGSEALTASRDGTARLWSTASGECRQRFQGHRRSIRRALFSPDGRKVVTTSVLDGTTRLWCKASGSCLHSFDTGAAPTAATFSTNGEELLIAVDNAAQLWSGRALVVRHTMAGHEDHITAAAFHGERLLTAAADGGVKLWSSGRCLWTLVAHRSHIFSVAFSPDGHKLLTASLDRTAKVWSTDKGEHLQSLKGHTSAVESAAFSPDGQQALTRCYDRIARLWAWETAECLHTFLAAEHAVFSH